MIHELLLHDISARRGSRVPALSVRSNSSDTDFGRSNPSFSLCIRLSPLDRSDNEDMLWLSASHGPHGQCKRIAIDENHEVADAARKGDDAA